MNDSTMKHCSKCGVLKPLSEFHKNKNFPDGHQYKCKECARQTAREHHRANREKHLEQMKEYAAKHKEELTEWRKNNREKLNQINSRYYYKHRSRLAKERKDRYRQSADYRIAKVAAASKYRKTPRGKCVLATQSARRRSGDGYSPEDVRDQYKHQKGKCYWCKKKVGQNYHVDHVVPLAKGGDNDKWNIVISCPECNLSKRDKLPHEWTNRLC